MNAAYPLVLFSQPSPPSKDEGLLIFFSLTVGIAILRD
jgi:hypothetical protein